MDNRCISCHHWRLPDKDKKEFFGAEDLATPPNPSKPDEEWGRISTLEEQRELFGYATRYCRSPKLKFYERPGKDEASVADGSEYMAVLITGEDFGCVNWTQKIIQI